MAMLKSKPISNNNLQLILWIGIPVVVLALVPLLAGAGLLLFRLSIHSCLPLRPTVTTEPHPHSSLPRKVRYKVSTYMNMVQHKLQYTESITSWYSMIHVVRECKRSG